MKEDEPSPFGGCVAAAALLIAMMLVCGAIALAIVSPGHWRAPVMVIGVLALLLMAKEAKR